MSLLLIAALGHLGEISEMDHILDKMRSRIKEQIDGDPEEIINLRFVKKAIPISNEAFAKTYISGLEKAGFPE